VSLLETAFREESEKGSDADLIYVDVNDYPGAYALRGLYTKGADNQIRLKLKLFNGMGNAIDLDIPSTDDPRRLVRFILRELKKAIRDQ
jgi:hypothetical protein